jgi:hypothetical protein
MMHTPITTKTLVYTICLLAVLFVTPIAYAHRPGEDNLDGLTEIPDPEISFAYYRQLDSSSPMDVYSFEGQGGQFFHAGINIPQLSGLENYQVNIALLGPGFPPLDSAIRSQDTHAHGGPNPEDHVEEILLADLPIPSDINLEQIGGLFVANQDGEDFFEPFTQTRYWGRQELDINLPEDGRYYLLVWNPEGAEGKYVLATGTQEVFEPADLLRFPIWWLNTRLYFEQGHLILIVASIFFTSVIAVGVYRWKKH